MFPILFWLLAPVLVYGLVTGEMSRLTHASSHSLPAQEWEVDEDYGGGYYATPTTPPYASTTYRTTPTTTTIPVFDRGAEEALAFLEGIRGACESRHPGSHPQAVTGRDLVGNGGDEYDFEQKDLVFHVDLERRRVHVGLQELGTWDPCIDDPRFDATE